MIHYGDITKINGHEIPLVDIITGGSPCQDLSVAGKRKGLAGERSGLFMEQIRIIKEMRDESAKQLRVRGANVDIRYIQPRYMVWENVTGAFSSNKGEDFRCVLEEVCRVADKTANVPRPTKGRWSKSGCIMGTGWSVAWRLHDAQFWGVPQRRKRIALVADFGGETAPEILFERKSMFGDSEKGYEQGKETTSSIRTGANPTSYTLKIRGGAEIDSHGRKAGKGALIQTELSATLGVSQDQTLITNKCLRGAIADHPTSKIDTNETAFTLASRDYKNSQTIVLENPVYPIGHNIKPSKLTADEKTDLLNAFDNNEGRTSALVLFEPRSQDGVHRLHNDNICPTLTTAQGGQRQPYISTSIVRRLTPLECERLQGYPDHWTDIGEWTDSKGKKHKDADSPRYKALGNSIALPFWEWMAGRMVKQLGVDKPTMASLFDGIGGFPLVYSRCGCKPVWASEIEEFPMAVTKIRFPEG
jgi:DNA (cytosine-5)-methyltransferase 1